LENASLGDLNWRFSVSILTSGLVSLSVNAGMPTTNTVIVPPELAEAFGPQHGGVLLPTDQFQQIYPQAHFASAPTDVLEITGLAFRLDESETNVSTVTISNASLTMGTTADPGLDFFANLPTPVRVYSDGPLAFNVQKNRTPSNFDVASVFQQSFIYNRRRGALVLQGRFSGMPGYVTDGGVGGGYLLYYAPMHETQVIPTETVTLFTYRPVPVITSIRVADGSPRIEFEAQSLEGVAIQAAPSVTEPFITEPAQLTTLSANLFEAVLAPATTNRFWRIKLQGSGGSIL
jgi:hypothetical protein